MTGRNPAPWILALTVAIAAAVFAIVHNAHPEDISGRKAGTAATITVAVGILIMVIAQTVWTTRSRRRAELESIRAVTEPATRPSDPANLSPEAMIMLLAIEPIRPEEALAARSAGWDIAQTSQRTAAVMTCLVIFLMVPAIVLQDARVIVFAAIPIVLYAVVLAVRVVRPGGTLDQAYEVSDAQLAPLGLGTVERPALTIEPRPSGDGMQPRLRGPTVLGGTRHGRTVDVQIDASKARTHVAAPSAAFELEGHRQRLRAEGDAPLAVTTFLSSLGASPNWTSVKVEAGAKGIAVTRKVKAGERPWLYDLWLAERLADLQAGSG